MIFFPAFWDKVLLLGLEHRLGESGGVIPFPLLPDSENDFTGDLLHRLMSSLKICSINFSI